MVTNSGSMTGTDIVLTDAIPDKTVYLGESMTLDGGGLTDADDNDAGFFSEIDNEIVIDLDPVPAGVSRVVIFTVMIATPLGGGTHVIPNRASVTSPAGPVDSNTVTVEVYVKAIPTMGTAGSVLLVVLIGLTGVMVMRRRLI